MNELKPCPFCGVNEWQYHAHFSGASVFQCEKCGAIVDECVLNTRPIEDARVKLCEYIEGLESELVELQPYRDGYDAYDVFPEDGDNVIANLGSWVFLAHYRNNEWYDSLGEQPKIRGGVERWWKLPEVQE